MHALRLPVLRLRWLIALLFGALTILLISGIGSIVEHEGTRRIRETNATHLRHVADHFAARFDRHLYERWQFLRALRDGSLLGRAETSDVVRVEIAQRARRFFVDFSLIAIAAMDATILLGDPVDAVGQTLIGPDETPDVGRIEFLPAIDGRSRLPVPTYWLPLRDPAAPRRALVGQLDWSTLGDIRDLALLDRRPDDGVRILLVAANAVIEVTEAGMSEIAEAPERRAALARLGATLSQTQWEGEPHVGVRVPLKAPRHEMPIPLDVVVIQDLAASLAPVTELRRSVVEAGAGFVAFAAVIGWLLAWWIAAPLDRIARIAARDAPVDSLPGSSRYREIGEVAASLTRLLTRTREEGARLATAFATSLDGAMVIDDSGRIESLNPAAQRLFGRGPEEVTGAHVRLLLPEPRTDEHDGYMHRFLGEAGQRISGIGRVLFGRRADGSTFPCLVTVGESELTAGRRVFTAFVRDMTDARENERRLRNAQAEIDSMHRLISVGQVGSQLSHEINQPLGAISNYAQAARQLIASDGEECLRRVDSLLAKLIAQVTRASDILRQLRRFVAKPAAVRQPRDINALIRRSITLAISGPGFDHIRVSTDLARDLPRVRIDQVEMQQVLTNLITNAGQAMSQSSEALLEIRSRREDGHVAIEVADRGTGLDPAVADRLFTPFVTTKPGGLGLGLSICRAIVEAHDGKLSAGANPAGGAVFKILLPLESTHG